MKGKRMSESCWSGKCTLCWDCRKAITKQCSWAYSFTPVEGWVAEKTDKREYTSYNVVACPEFVRDAWGFGLQGRVKHG